MMCEVQTLDYQCGHQSTFWSVKSLLHLFVDLDYTSGFQILIILTVSRFWLYLRFPDLHYSYGFQILIILPVFRSWLYFRFPDLDYTSGFQILIIIPIDHDYASGFQIMIILPVSRSYLILMGNPVNVCGNQCVRESINQ